jgi:hypothetical protein
MKLRFEGVRNSGSFGHFDLGNRLQEMKVVQPVRAYAQHVHSTRDHYSQRRYIGGNYGDYNDEGEFVAPITQVDKWNSLGRYTRLRLLNMISL